MKKAIRFAICLEVLLAIQLGAGPRPAQDLFFSVPLKELAVSSGQWPASRPGLEAWRKVWEKADFLAPYVVGEPDAEMYFLWGAGDDSLLPYSWLMENDRFVAQARLVVRSTKTKKVAGHIFVSKSDFSGFCRIDVVVDQPNPDQAAARRDFFVAKERHYRRLWQTGWPGGAWFRRQVQEAGQALVSEKKGKTSVPAVPPQPVREAESELHETFALFSGGRALSENLQLDRQLRIDSGPEETVPLASLSGITMAAMDWKKELPAAPVARDFLSGFIPEDQHALFFPSLTAMLDLMDEIDNRGTPVDQLLELRAEDAQTRERYQRQLCLPAGELARLFGPALVRSVAWTGSDPYLRTGTDLAVLFETPNPALLQVALAQRANAGAASGRDAREVSGTLSGFAYAGVCSPDRAICSYRMQVNDRVVVVTNSLAQLQRLAAVAGPGGKSVARLDEYAFFRNRYRLGEADEVALLFVSDATIRRWCGPRWRIADSRRTRAAATMMDIQAEHLEPLAAGNAVPPGSKEWRFTAGGIASPVYGDLEFMTPIAELPIDRVSAAEARAYEWFRDNYQSHWRQYLDPLAIRFTMQKHQLGVDFSIRPLIAESDYRGLMSLSGNTILDSTAGDPHSQALIHFVLALDPKCPTVRSATRSLTQLVSTLDVGAMNWVGNWLTVYLDDDPFWQELLAQGKNDERDAFMQKNLRRLPVAFAVQVRDSLKLTLFLSALRGFMEQTSPGMTSWETVPYKKSQYVRIRAKTGPSSGNERFAFEIFYAPTSDALLLTLSETVMRGFLDRRLTSSHPTGLALPAATPWSGGSLCIQLRSRGLDLVRDLSRESWQEALRRRSFANLPILNEWRRRFPQYSPQEFHNRFWKTKLICPGGGDYVWNEEYQTMESTLFGHPGAIREAGSLPDLLGEIMEMDMGVTFEHNGLRARVQFQRRR
jgi:hypothetical protein